jgi:two-component system cell cycle response regulator
MSAIRAEPRAGDAALRERILVVEDNANLRLALEAMLNGTYDVTLAENGALGIASARADPPSLIVTDLIMPACSGFDLCKTLKADAATAHVPVIILTARGDLEHKLEGFECGADDYLQKPFHARELLARIGTLIENRRLQRELARKNRELERAVAELREAQSKLVESERLKTALNMAGALAHEINNPLSGLMGYCDLVRAALGPDHPLKNDLEKIIEQANRIAGVMRKIQTLREVRFVRYVGDETIVDLGVQ